MRAVNNILSVLLGLLFTTAYADVPKICNGSFVNPVTDVCWSCLFPMSLGSMSAFGDNPDTPNPRWPVCTCGLRLGLTIGYWEPIALVDVTHHPYCMVNLGGYQLPMGDENATGNTESASSDHNNSFYYVHWYFYPLISWLRILTDIICLDMSDFDIAYLTELDPSWHDDELTFLLNPEAVLFANPISQAACAADSIKSAVDLPIDSLFWCAGSQGGMYPLDGHIQEHVGGVQASTLVTERMTYKMHREGLLWDSTGDVSSPLDEKICHQYPTPILPKSRYRYQMVNPIPTTGSGGCFPFGHTTAIWGSEHEYPYTGEDFGYLIWRKRNCCAL